LSRKERLLIPILIRTSVFKCQAIQCAISPNQIPQESGKAGSKAKHEVKEKIKKFSALQEKVANKN
jgi:hypothetical protein